MNTSVISESKSQGMTAPMANGELSSKWEKLLELLASENIKSWLDSGSLLGMVRSGRLNAWEKDIDLGIWSEDFERTEKLCQQFSEQNGFYFRVLRLRGIPYVILLDILDPQKSGSLPIAVHVFYRVGHDAWSPQPHSVVWATAKLPRHRLQQEVRANGRWAFISFAKRYPHHVLALLLAKLRLTRSMGSWMKSWSRKNWSTGKHLADSRMGAILFDFFQWVVPAHYFDDLRPFDEQKPHVLVPAATAEYLKIRYGDWMRPVKRWFYLADDGCLFPLRDERFEVILMGIREAGIAKISR